MTKMTSIELLEASYDFPCLYSFKAIGSTSDDFVERVIAAVREELELDFDPPYQLRNTPAGRHVSVHIEVSVASPEAVLAVYSRLQQTTGLVMLM